jgi:tetratricopeptide (TPR) repeat protein
MNLDGYLMKFGTNFVYNRMLIVNNRKKWKFIGVLHEYIKCTEDTGPHGLLDGNYYVESGRTGNRSKDPDKYKKDALVLKKGFEEEKDEALRHRYAFYCAQSYNNCNQIDEAIEWYSKCLSFPMWNQEKFYSALTLGNIYNGKKDHCNALKYWLKTVEYDSDRIEGIVHACEYYRNNNVHLLVNLLYNKFKTYHNQKDLKNKLFVATDLYNYILE